MSSEPAGPSEMVSSEPAGPLEPAPEPVAEFSVRGAFHLTARRAFVVHGEVTPGEVRSAHFPM